jgi:uncharacterized protein (DUF433 family)
MVPLDRWADLIYPVSEIDCFREIFSLWMRERFGKKGRCNMSLTAPKLDYPYITSDPGIAGGRPVITGTRITVNCIAGYYQLGMSIDEILESLQHLTPSQVHSALAYYFDHQDEINEDMEEAGNVEYWKSQVQAHPTAIA